MSPVIPLLSLSLFGTSVFAQSWSYERIVDDFTDEVKHFAEVAASDGEGVIWVICFEDSKTVEMRVSTGLWLDSKDDMFDRKPVRWRIDKRDPVTDRWPGSDLLSMVPEQKALDLSRGLSSGMSHVLIELASWDGDTKRARFPLRNSRRSIGRVLTACDKSAH